MESKRNRTATRCHKRQGQNRTGEHKKRVECKRREDYRREACISPVVDPTSQISLGVQHDILWFEISEHNTVLMNMS